ncbi:DUF2635 domain-containing protein [Aliivibrio finisterrensis]|uniref:DUF2635 domain-containing protein n=1 Tax=Aliivibrio finisterrensis TaxID=511998 RepID=A0ABY0I2M1_9GAMM|nr:DUF2635 domain-containing protein [Aliivibrio finisterrensis]RYU50040.1 DUF2635 domain-containing protein [Aliivibrio finisterrensis]RYU55741.1 DUF2635 domain-containing protein [Aliivibrio finisterrensis]RYU62195.1 DUF2635 domain-containing protein [Aliivibrio finisterrensis]RYU80932.1 DUF2635 domain-containing protein [Aliivibrio finisterrensis]RYU84455.1 DUF2635 domain-containing protein [Aliivibrio finisterrensis]
MREMTIKPATKGLLVRDPITREPLKASGEMKPRNAYWLRRILDTSVVEVNSKKKEGVK